MRDPQHFEWACDHAREFTGVFSTNSELVAEIPALDSLLYGAALKIKGDLSGRANWLLNMICSNIIPLAEEASLGDPLALAALEAIHSITTPNLLNFTPQTLEKLAGRAYKAWFARACVLVELMNDLSWVVEPTKSQAKMSPTCSVRPFESLTEEIKEEARFYRDESIETLHAFARQHCRKNTTLQALAIKVFNALNERDGYATQDERVLKRDLQMFKKWVADHVNEAPAGAWLDLRGEEITLYGSDETEDKK